MLDSDMHLRFALGCRPVIGTMASAYRPWIPVVHLPHRISRPRALRPVSQTGGA
jgi:hypothetical protein